MGICALKPKTLPGGTCCVLDFREINKIKEGGMETISFRLRGRKERVFIIFFSDVPVC